jgi:hypothetical protein
MVHNRNMRTNINIAEDAREVASAYANARGITLGEAVTELIRKGLRADSRQEPRPIARSFAGFPVFPKSGRAITTEMVRKAEEDEID